MGPTKMQHFVVVRRSVWEEVSKHLSEFDHVCFRRGAPQGRHQGFEKLRIPQSHNEFSLPSEIFSAILEEAVSQLMI